MFDGIDLPTAYESPPIIESNTLLATTMKLSSLVSIISSSIILISFISWKRFRTPANRLIFFMTISDLLSAICHLLSSYTLPLKPLSQMCQINPLLLQFADLSSIAWTAAMACNLFMVLFMTKSARDLTILEKVYFYICYGISFIIAFIPLYFNIYSECSINKEYILYLYYIPIWAVFVFNSTIYIVSSYRVLSRSSQMPQRCQNPLQQQPPLQPPPPTITLPRRTRHGSSFHGSLYGDKQRVLSQTSSSTGTGSLVSLNTLLTFRRRYFFKIGMFFVGYLIAWIVPSGIYIRGLVGESEFVLLYINALIVPLRGFINFICYFTPAVISVLEERRREVMKQRVAEVL